MSLPTDVSYFVTMSPIRLAQSALRCANPVFPGHPPTPPATSSEATGPGLFLIFRLASVWPLAYVKPDLQKSDVS